MANPHSGAGETHDLTGVALARGNRQVVSTPCKVNTYLGVHAGRDARGYHRVDSLMLPVAIYDEVVVSAAETLAVCHEPALEVPPERTTVWKAATLLAEALGVKPRVRIDVGARIPERAGLGGSSADAGATLRALAERWGVSARDERVISVARRVGADVPFFLDPEPGLYEGAGDTLVRTFPGVRLALALVMPAEAGASTAEAYAEFDRLGEEPAGSEAACVALERGDAHAIAGALYNNLAPAACALSESVGRTAEWVAAQEGVLGSQVTGSGACSFAICEDMAAAERIACRARGAGWRAWATHTIA